MEQNIAEKWRIRNVCGNSLLESEWEYEEEIETKTWRGARIIGVLAVLWRYRAIIIRVRGRSLESIVHIDESCWC